MFRRAHHKTKDRFSGLGSHGRRIQMANCTELFQLQVQAAIVCTIKCIKKISFHFVYKILNNITLLV